MLAEIKLWGRTIGAATIDDTDVCTFEYAQAFLNSTVQPSPIVMPLSAGLFRFPGLPRDAFQGLPGLLADSLPDKFGNAIINAWLASQGRTASSFNAIERLCYIGTRGMGALEFHPTQSPVAPASERVEIARLVELASEILTHRNSLQTRFGKDDSAALGDILRIGTSAGGARAKAVIAWNPETREVRSGQADHGAGFSHWLLKFDGVKSNRDKELDDPKGFTAIEYAYHLMALDAGIDMMPCQLLEENDRRHFLTQRFDRTTSGEKVHMQSLAALNHFDFNLAGAYSYEQAFLTMRQLGLNMDAIEEQFRRMCFNIVARNQDDHVKNIAFLMDKKGRWSLSPAYDVTYSYNPQGRWTSAHQMTLNNKSDDFTLADFRAAAKSTNLKRGRARTILAEVTDAVAKWPQHAENTNIPQSQYKPIAKTHRLSW